MDMIKRFIKAKKTKSVLDKLPTEVVSKAMGCDRGAPVDRFYIEKFLNENKKYIHGDCMEIADTTYISKFGSNVKNAYIFTAEADRENAITGDLTTGKGCKPDAIDCFILTQTLPFMFDIQNAAKNIIMMLRPGGVALVTVRGISMISRYDEQRWGDYWGFTVQSLEKIFLPVTSKNNIEIISYGNVKTATAFLYGLCQEDLEMKDFIYDDPLVPVIIAGIIKKGK